MSDRFDSYQELAVRVTTMEKNWEERRSGGAGSLTNPLSNGEYRKEMDKLSSLAAADQKYSDSLE